MSSLPGMSDRSLDHSVLTLRVGLQELSARACPVRGTIDARVVVDEVHLEVVDLLVTKELRDLLVAQDEEDLSGELFGIELEVLLSELELVKLSIESAVAEHSFLVTHETPFYVLKSFSRPNTYFLSIAKIPVQDWSYNS